MKKIFAIFSLFFTTHVLYSAEIPTFPGGEAALNKYFKENIKYPAIAAEDGVEGVVEVGFMVNADGSLSNIKVLNFVDPDLEKEAMRVVSAMPAWIPAEHNGVAVEAASKVDVPFILE